MSIKSQLACLLLAFVSLPGSCLAQARKQLTYDWQPSQFSATYQWTLDDYSLRVSSTQLQKTRLNGAAGEYAFRSFYPWEIIGAIQYSQGQPLAQHLMAAQAGLGYCRGYKHWIPFGRVLAGMARTSSTKDMYLYPRARSGFALGMSVGSDYQLTPRFGIRVIQVQNQYLPFGSNGSVYWSLSSGINFRLHQ